MYAMSDQISLIKQLGSHGIACLGLATEVNKLNFSEKKFLTLSSNLFMKDLNWKPAIKLKDSIKLTSDWYFNFFNNKFFS